MLSTNFQKTSLLHGATARMVAAPGHHLSPIRIGITSLIKIHGLKTAPDPQLLGICCNCTTFPLLFVFYIYRYVEVASRILLGVRIDISSACTAPLVLLVCFDLCPQASQIGWSSNERLLLVADVGTKALPFSRTFNLIATSLTVGLDVFFNHVTGHQVTIWLTVSSLRVLIVINGGHLDSALED